MRIVSKHFELAAITVLYLLVWLSYCQYIPQLDQYQSPSSSGRRSPAIGLLAVGAAEVQEMVNRAQMAIAGVPNRRKSLMIAPTSSGQASPIFADDNEILPFVAPTSILGVDPRKKNKTRHTDTIRCYSCMSPFYESAWMQSLSRIYAKPMNFSQECDDSGSLRGIALVECPSICIKIREDIELSGIPFRGYIRGCYDTMLLHGFNQTLVRWFRWLQRDSCMDYNKYQILQLPPHPSRQATQKTGTLHICTCYADTCNGAPKYSGASVTARVSWFRRSLTFSLGTTIAPLLVFICWWWRTVDYYLVDRTEKFRLDLCSKSDSILS